MDIQLLGWRLYQISKEGKFRISKTPVYFADGILVIAKIQKIFILLSSEMHKNILAIRKMKPPDTTTKKALKLHVETRVKVA